MHEHAHYDCFVHMNSTERARYDFEQLFTKLDQEDLKSKAGLVD